MCFVLCLCPDSQPECPLHLWSAVELLSAKQQQQPWPQCASWIETLPYKALGTVASANFFFFFCKMSQSLCSTPPRERRSGLSTVFFGFCSTPVKKTRCLPGVQGLKMSHFTSAMCRLVFWSGGDFIRVYESLRWPTRGFSKYL